MLQTGQGCLFRNTVGDTADDTEREFIKHVELDVCNSYSIDNLALPTMPERYVAFLLLSLLSRVRLAMVTVILSSISER